MDISNEELFELADLYRALVRDATVLDEELPRLVSSSDRYQLVQQYKRACLEIHKVKCLVARLS